MQDNMVNVGIVLLPSEEVSQAAIQLSKDIAVDFKTFFVLGEESCLPHISLYHAAFPERNIPQVKRELTTLTENSSSFPMELPNVSWQEEGWLDLQAVKSESLVNLHHAVVQAFNSLREGSIMALDESAFSSYSPEEQNNLKLYGYRHAASLFRPHLTITRLQEGNVTLAVQKLEGTTLSFLANTLALCQLGEHNTCGELLGEFELK